MISLSTFFACPKKWSKKGHRQSVARAIGGGITIEQSAWQIINE